jgi:D-2-hydroxyacid dehydrogenase (NADP+)
MYTLLISDARAAAYAERISAADPNLRVLTATHPGECRKLIREAEGLVTFGAELDAAMLDSATHLRWIQALSSGTDRIASLLKRPENIILTSARGVHGPAVAEMAVLLMLALARRFVVAVRNQDNHLWVREPGTLLHQKTLGIAGMGVIGSQIAALARAFGMRVIGFGSVPRAASQVDAFYPYTDLQTRASDLDILVVVTPLSAATVGMIDRRVFARMKRTALLVNVGRGPVVNEGDLVDALRGGLIAGAALDTLSEEPLPATSILWSLNNLIITPHIAGDHDRYPETVLPVIMSNIRCLLAGRPQEMINRVSA